MQTHVLNQADDWKLLFEPGQTNQVLISHVSGGKARIQVASAQPTRQEYRGSELMSEDLSIPLLVPPGRKVYGRCLNTSSSVTIGVDTAATEAAQLAAVAALNTRMTDLEASRTRKFTATVGNGVLTSFTFMHNFNTTDVVVQVFAGNGLIVPLTVVRTANGVTVTFALGLAANSRVVILG